MTDVVYVFDLDDTLYLERDYVRSGFLAVGRSAQERFDVEGLGERAWSLFNAGVRGSTFDQLATEFSLPQGAVRFLIDAYREHEPEIDLLDDARAFLAALPSDAIGTGLITDGYAMGQRRKIRALGLDALLENIIVTSEHGPDWTKPGEHAFRRIQAAFTGPGTEFVYFGDNPAKDFDAPIRLGWRTVRVRRELGLHYRVEDRLRVDETITTFAASVAPAAPTTPTEENDHP